MTPTLLAVVGVSSTRQVEALLTLAKEEPTPTTGKQHVRIRASEENKAKYL
jgi:hypothetical protein